MYKFARKTSGNNVKLPPEEERKSYIIPDNMDGCEEWLMLKTSPKRKPGVVIKGEKENTYKVIFINKKTDKLDIKEFEETENNEYRYYVGKETPDNSEGHFRKQIVGMILACGSFCACFKRANPINREEMDKLQENYRHYSYAELSDLPEGKWVFTKMSPFHQEEACVMGRKRLGKPELCEVFYKNNKFTFSHNDKIYETIDDIAADLGIPDLSGVIPKQKYPILNVSVLNPFRSKSAMNNDFVVPKYMITKYNMHDISRIFENVYVGVDIAIRETTKALYSDKSHNGYIYINYSPLSDYVCSILVMCENSNMKILNICFKNDVFYIDNDGKMLTAKAIEEMLFLNNIKVINRKNDKDIAGYSDECKIYTEAELSGLFSNFDFDHESAVKFMQGSEEKSDKIFIRKNNLEKSGENDILCLYTMLSSGGVISRGMITVKQGKYRINNIYFNNFFDIFALQDIKITNIV